MLRSIWEFGFCFVSQLNQIVRLELEDGAAPDQMMVTTRKDRRAEDQIDSVRLPGMMRRPNSDRPQRANVLVTGYECACKIAASLSHISYRASLCLILGVVRNARHPPSALVHQCPVTNRRSPLTDGTSSERRRGRHRSP